MIATLLLLTATGVKAGEKKRTLTNEARKYTNVEKVNTAEEAQSQHLPPGYTGEGVVLGVRDSGRDYRAGARRTTT